MSFSRSLSVYYTHKFTVLLILCNIFIYFAVYDISEELSAKTVMYKKHTEQIRKTLTYCEKRMQAPSFIYEQKRQRFRTTLQYLWDSILEKINKLKKKNRQKKVELKAILDTIYNHKISILSDWKVMSQNDGYEEWRQQNFKKLGNLVQKRFNYLMNPKNCSEAKLLKCIDVRRCGWGCQHVYYAMSFAVAYGLERVLFYSKNPVHFYEKDEYSRYYEPISKTCIEKNIKGTPEIWPGKNTSHIIHCPHSLRNVRPKVNYTFRAVPEDLMPVLSKITNEPSAWWIGQIQKFIFKIKPEYQKKIDEVTKEIGFEHPIVGIHVRRTDKIKETRSYKHLREYMKHVKEYYDILALTQKVHKKRVYLATDDYSGIQKELSQYSKEFIFITNPLSRNSKRINARNDSFPVMVDVTLLSKCDHFVGTFSSNIGRRVLELMFQARYDSRERVVSIDKLYNEHLQNPYKYRMVIKSSNITNPEELDAKVGDINYFKSPDVKAGKVSLHNKNMTRKIPLYKIEILPEVAKFPIYKNVV